MNLYNILERILQDLLEEVSNEQDTDLVTTTGADVQKEIPSTLDIFPVHYSPNELQEPEDLRLQAEFLTSLVLGRGAPSLSTRVVVCFIAPKLYYVQ